MRIICIVSLFLWVQSAQAQFTKLYDFASDNDLKYPKGDAVYDGTWLYGLTTGGGTAGLGCVFKIKPDGTGLTKLIDFNGTNGSNPYGSLTLSGSVIYGMTMYGGVNNKGVIFKVNTDGTGFTKLLDFDGTIKGAYPIGSLIISGTTLYGMTYNGGLNDYGVIFKINTDGTGYLKMLDFDGNTYGAYPARGFTISGSVLYGTTTSGGIYSDGVVFRINMDGSGYLKLVDFNSTNGSNPWSTPILSGSTLYGTTYYGGINSKGVLFKVNTDGSGFSKLVDFDGTIYGANPFHSLILSGSTLYGTTYYGGLNNYGVIFKISTSGTGFTKLLDFSGLNGAYPISPLTVSGSTLYGMTASGGSSNRGTIFKINTDGTGYNKIINCKNSPSGIYPLFSKYVSDGTWLYGTTNNGGNGYGVIYKIKTDGTGYSRFFVFDGSTYGANPTGLFLSGSTLFGTTNSGGAYNRGTIFKINIDGTGLTKILDFDQTNNGSAPDIPIVSGSTIYGCTNYGGANSMGVIYKINTDGTGYTKLLDFEGSSNGRQPNCSLVLSGSTLYGTTTYGGINDRGTVFKINTDGTGYSKMYDFDGTNGSIVYGSLALFGSALYGMTYSGGSNGLGVIFKINTDGTNFTKLIDLDGTIYGSNPYNSFTLSGSSLYGSTVNGGTNNFGVLFKITSDGTYTKLLDFDGVNGKYPFSNLFEMNCTLYATTNEGGTYDGGTVFKYELGPSDAGSISGNTSVCEGQTGIIYSVPVINNATSYIWTLPPGSTGSSTTNSISVSFGTGSISGSVTVKGSNSSCNGTASAYTVTVNHVPSSAGAITGSPTVAQGQNSVAYSVAAIGNATSYIWNYSGNGATINGTGNSVTLNFSSTATSGNLTVYGMSNCGNGTISANYSVTVNPPPPVVGTITQPTCVLQTGSVVLNGLPSSGSWTMTRSPGGITTSGTGTSTTITDLATGTYTFTVTNALGRTSAASTNVVILTPKTGIIPKIKAKWGDVLICYNLLDSISNWQWYKGSSAIPGATKQYYVTNKLSGDYWVMTTDKAGCINFSNIISISTGAKSISVYPNPASVSFSLKINDESSGSAVVTILNSSGIKVLEFRADNTNDKILREIPVSNLDQGIYFVQVMLNEKELYYTKIMVVK